MRRQRSLVRALALTVLVLAPSAVPARVAADPEDPPTSASQAAELPAFGGPAFGNMALVANSDKDGVSNSDLAFWGDLVFAGNYSGFRILNVADPARPQVLVDYFCRGPQNDVSVYRVGARLLLFQSVDRPQTKESCDGTPAGSSQDTPTSGGLATFGFEGIRIFDVTEPRAPRFLDGVPTACGSHTHTLVPDDRRDRLHLYVSSYPLGSDVTPANTPGSGPFCRAPHRKISIVTVPFHDPLAATVAEKLLSQDTAAFGGTAVQGCHDVQVLLKYDVAVGSCMGEAQIWDISDRGNPTSGDGEPHTHVASPSATDAFEFIHSGVITWDGAYFAVMDESGGGNGAQCDGSAPEQGGASQHGFYYFYPLVRPGAAPPALVSRYMIPRPQAAEVCVAHNGGTLPVNDRYLMSSAYYQGGNTVVDFSNVAKPVEVAYSDPADTTGLADSWSTYWYNDLLYSSSGLGRRGSTANRGLDILSAVHDGQPIAGRTQHHLNPQTQDAPPVRPTVFRPAQGRWYVSDGIPETVAWGFSGDVPVPADYDDDGYDEPAVFRPSSGTWYLGGTPATAVAWGTEGDVAVPGDYDGDGRNEPAVFRPSSGTWYLGGASPQAFAWGTGGDVPVPADYDGDGDDDPAVYRPAHGTWHVRGGSPGTVVWGTSGDVPVPADYDGDGRADPAVFRPAQGTWYIGGGAPALVAWGTAGDVARPADYDRDGDDDPAIFRPSQGAWYLRSGSPGFVSWGAQGDVPAALISP